MFIKHFGLVQHHAEQDTDTGAENCQHGDADGVADSEGGNRINEKKFLRNSERNGNPMRNKGRDYAWNPNNAEKQALMPHMIIICLSLSSK